MSRLIDRLDAEIAAAVDPVSAECLKAERAATLARCGQLSEARFALRGLKIQAQRRRHGRLRAWVSFATGLIEHFDALAPGANQSFEAASREAAEAGDTRLGALATAWLANGHFNARRLAPMADGLVLAWQGAPAADDGGTRARVALVRADASRLAGLHGAAQAHYLAVRRLAMADGDTAMLAAMAHNRASGQTDRLDLEDAFGRASQDETRRVLLEAESCLNLDLGMGNQALSALTPLMKARLVAVLQRWEEAVALFDTYLERASREGMGGLTPHLLLNRAWCHWRLGDRIACEADVARALPEVETQPDADDRAASHARLAALAQARGDAAGAAGHQRAADAALADFRAFQASIGAQLARVDAALGA